MAPVTFSQRLRRDPLILPFYLPSFILSVSWGLLVPVMPLYAKELNPSYAVVGLIMAGESIGMLLGDIPAGLLIRRLGQKQTMLCGAACAACATAALFWAPSVSLALTLRVLAGFGRALFTVSRHAYVAGVATAGSRGRALALFGGMMRIGAFLGPMAGGAIAVASGLRAPFLVFAAANLAALVTMALFVRQTTEAKQTRHVRSAKAAYGYALRSRGSALAAAGAGQLLAQMIRTGRDSIIPLIGADIIGLDVASIGLIVSLASALDMSLFYPAGWIMDRFGRKFAIVPSFLIQAAGMLVLPLAGSFVGLLGVAALIALGNGIGSGTMMTLGADLAPAEARGEFLGIWRLIGDSGQMGGAMVVGQVANLVALPVAALALAAAGIGAGLVFWLFVPEPLKRPQKASLPESGQAPA